MDKTALTPNRAKIFNYLLKHQNHITVKEINEATDIPITTIKDYLYVLEKQGVCAKEALKQKNVIGRPKIIWSLI